MHLFEVPDLFSKLFYELDSTTKNSRKVQALTHYFNQATDPDKLMVIAIFTGRRPKRQVKLSELKQWAIKTAQIPDWLFEESYSVVGDLAETIHLILKNSVSPTPLPSPNYPVPDTWYQLPFIKLLTGGFRLGVSQGLLVQALHAHTGIEKDELNLRLMGNWTVQNTNYQDLIISPKPHLNSTKPYPFFLASPFNEDPQSTDIHPLADYQIEPKWDGIRAQIIKRNNSINLWSRGEDIITHQFPELASSMLSWDAFSGALDGEILCWDFELQLPRPFQDLQKRLGRKSPGKKTLTDYPVVFLAYDLLEIDGQDLRQQHLSHRRQQLDNLFPSPNTHIQPSPVFHPKDFEELQKIRNESSQIRSEGLMIKRRDSQYGIGRKRGDWWKWKIDADTVDAVLIYAQRGHGRRANLYTDFTFAIYKGEELVPFAKAYSGLTDAEILEVNKWIKLHTRESFGPVKSVDAKLVFELAFEGINRSTRHKSGIAVRFPRIVRWRRDKSVKDIATLEELLSRISI